MLVIGLSTCSHVGSLKLGKEIYGFPSRCCSDGIESVRNALITMYLKCKDMEHACLFVSNGQNEVFGHMEYNVCRLSPVRPSRGSFFHFLRHGALRSSTKLYNRVTYLALCACVANLQHGRELHCYIIKHDFKGFLLLWNSLIDMYSES
ncbi:hypothetical protein C4D60_Mb11t17160 [Musa balbisiana]|uniref:Uncharacterized protein n=1 Tax=Musa balbisiana TaxID=52838 RepID=A0A4S8J5P5_MUSBA|nr:hypothetical protein C4D60_Mb11t17160 [Musa balbisiana]